MHIVQALGNRTEEIIRVIFRGDGLNFNVEVGDIGGFIQKQIGKCEDALPGIQRLPKSVLVLPGNQRVQ